MWVRIITAAFLGWASGILRGQEFDFPILLPQWDRDLSFRTGAGYRDNIGLSANSPRGSAFVMTGLELILLRLPENGTQFNLFVSGEDIRFFSSGPVDKEQSAFAHFGFELQSSAMFVHDPLGDGEAQAASFRLGGVKRIEEPLLHFGRDARSVVLDFEHDRFGGLALEPDIALAGAQGNGAVAANAF